MSYKLKEKESLEIGIKRIAYEQIDKATKKLSNTVDAQQSFHDKAEAIHDARKAFKKLRALVRLIRDTMGKEAYHQENNCYRDAGRLLSDVRDAQVNLETFEDLTEPMSTSVSSISPEFIDQIQNLLTVYKEITYHQVLEQKELIPSVLTMIQQGRERVESWSIETEDWSMIDAGIKRVYTRGYKGLARVINDPNTENLHEWRKRVKYLWYHLRILTPVWENMIKPLAKETHQLADLLGDDHDLAVLHQLLQQQPELIRQQPEFNLLFLQLERKRHHLQSSALKLGERIYSESPKQFIHRLGNYWKAWQHPLNTQEILETSLDISEAQLPSLA